MLKSIGKQSGESVLKMKWEAAVGRVCRKGRYAAIGHAKVTQVGRLLKVTHQRAAPDQGRSLMSTLLWFACTNKQFTCVSEIWASSIVRRGVDMQTAANQTARKLCRRQDCFRILNKLDKRRYSRCVLLSLPVKMFQNQWIFGTVTGKKVDYVVHSLRLLAARWPGAQSERDNHLLPCTLPNIHIHIHRFKKLHWQTQQ